MTDKATNQIHSDPFKAWHAHIYFNADCLDQAKEIIDAAGQRFPVNVGRLHEKNVGPHPAWSCQLAFAQKHFADVIPWLAANRRGLAILIHPCTGDDLKDHTDHAIWMGEVLPLELSIL